MIKIEAGERQYELVEGWGTLPEGWTWGQVAGVAADTGYTTEGRVPASPWASGSGLPIVNGVGRAGPPFNQPTDVAAAPGGDIFVSSNLVGRFGSERSNAPGKFWGPHCIWVDSHGDLYVGEVLQGQRLQKFARCK